MSSEEIIYGNNSNNLLTGDFRKNNKEYSSCGNQPYTPNKSGDIDRLLEEMMKSDELGNDLRLVKRKREPLENVVYLEITIK